MADNTTINAGSGGDVIATDDLTTLNGGAVSGFKAQRVKVGHGADATFTDAKGSTPLPVNVDGKRIVTFDGRVSTFRTPGRAGTAGQNLFAIHNATGSTVLVDIHKITVDLAVTVVKAVTVLPPLIRAWKVTVLPTNGTALTKVPSDSALSSSSSVTVFGDASADGTSSGTALTATRPAGTIITQEFASRYMGGAGTNPLFEPMDRAEFFTDEDEVVTLRALEGVVIFADYVLATQNPVTDMWAVSCRWDEYTLAP